MWCLLLIREALGLAPSLVAFVLFLGFCLFLFYIFPILSLDPHKFRRIQIWWLFRVVIIIDSSPSLPSHFGLPSHRDFERWGNENVSLSYPSTRCGLSIGRDGLRFWGHLDIDITFLPDLALKGLSSSCSNRPPKGGPAGPWVGNDFDAPTRPGRRYMWQLLWAKGGAMPGASSGCFCVFLFGSLAFLDFLENWSGNVSSF